MEVNANCCSELKDCFVLFMSWLKSTNAKEIGTLYLIFAVFSGMIGTAFSVLIRLELSSPGVQFLQGDHQLFNGAPSHYIVRSGIYLTGSTRSKDSSEFMSPKALVLAIRGQLEGENSMTKMLPERMVASYNFYGKDNESLQLFMPVQIPDANVQLICLVLVLRFHFLGHIFYVEV